MLLGSRH